VDPQGTDRVCNGMVPNPCRTFISARNLQLTARMYQARTR